MASEEAEEKSASYFVQDVDMRTVYANRATALLGSSDISMFFGVEDYKDNREIGRLSTRVVMSHSQFMLWVEYLATRYEMLKTMYGGLPPNIDTIATNDPERAKAAWAVIGIPSVPPQSESENGETEVVSKVGIDDENSAA